jgi:hypothetical protein
MLYYKVSMTCATELDLAVDDLKERIASSVSRCASGVAVISVDGAEELPSATPPPPPTPPTEAA